jgi:hypothetical protein
MLGIAIGLGLTIELWYFVRQRRYRRRRLDRDSAQDRGR